MDERKRGRGTGRGVNRSPNDRDQHFAIFFRIGSKLYHTAEVCLQKMEFPFKK